MTRPIPVLLAVYGILPIILIYLAPASWLDPYNWLNPESLNSVGPDERLRKWLNMGYWEDGTTDFSKAAETLGRKLIEFADVGHSIRILDVAHGSGESLLLHLSSPHPPQYLHALTPLPRDTLTARGLVDPFLSSNPSCGTDVEFHTASALPRLGKDNDHPLNPMKGYLGTNKPPGKRKRDPIYTDGEEDAYDADSETDTEYQADGLSASVTETKGNTGDTGKYDLIYVLDAIYHFQPNIYTFLSSAKETLNEGGIIAYTDILPPPSLNPFLKKLISVFLSVPSKNLNSERSSTVTYREKLDEVGFRDIEIEDWSNSVWPGFSRNLSDRGGVWGLVGSVVKKAEENGWRFVAVRLQK